jgi:hypothetical protein
MAKSIQAQAAAQIRAKLKEAGIKASVSSFSASMCDGVRVYCNEAELSDLIPFGSYTPEKFKALKDKISDIAMPYQYGHFNGMEDIYEYSSMIPGLPQVKFVQISYLD